MRNKYWVSSQWFVFPEWEWQILKGYLLFINPKAKYIISLCNCSAEKCIIVQFMKWNQLASLWYNQTSCVFPRWDRKLKKNCLSVKALVCLKILRNANLSLQSLDSSRINWWTYNIENSTLYDGSFTFSSSTFMSYNTSEEVVIALHNFLLTVTLNSL